MERKIERGTKIEKIKRTKHKIYINTTG